MAIVIADGFDLYGSLTDASQAGWNYNSSTHQSFSTSLGRYGGGCLRGSQATTAWTLGTPGYGAGTTFYVCFYFYLENRASSGASDVLLRGIAADGSSLMFRFESNSSGDIKAYGQPGVLLQTASGALSNTTWHRLEFKIVLGTNDTTGTLELKVDGTTVISQTGIDTFGSGTNNTVETISIFGSAGGYRVDDFMLLDTSGSTMNTYPGDYRIDTLIPNADGADLAWTSFPSGADYTQVDDTPSSADGDSTYISSTSAGDKNVFGFSNMSDNPSSIYAVQLRCKARKDDAGTRTYRGYLYSGSTKSDGDTKGLSVDYNWQRNGVWYVDPDGGGVWNRTKVNNLQAGVELVS